MGNFLKHIHPLLRRKKSDKDYEDVNYAIINSLETELTEVEKDTINSKAESSLKTATGEFLDTWGDWFNVVRREGEQDKEYRERIIKYFLLKRGTNNAIIDALRDYLNDYESEITIYEPFKDIFYTNKSDLNGKDHLMGEYYRFAIIDITIGRRFPIDIIEIINQFKPAGVKFYLTYDGSSNLPGDGIIKMPSVFQEISRYTNLDIFGGYDDITYGHVNLSNKKKTGVEYIDYGNGEIERVDIFRTNYSKMNSEHVLSGDPSTGKSFYNNVIQSSKVYTPKHRDNPFSMNTELNDYTDVDYMFYLNTGDRGGQRGKAQLSKEQGVDNLYIALDVYKYFQTNYNDKIKGMNSKEAIDTIKNIMTKPKIAYKGRALVSPDKGFTSNLQIFSFRSNKWETVSKNTQTLKWTDITVELGNMFDFLSDNGIIFIRLNNIVSDDITLEVDYLDIMFSHTVKNVYTIKPYLGKVMSEPILEFLNTVDAYKIASTSNGDIISKIGYQPIGYLRLTDGYDNNINRNLLLGTENYTTPFITSSIKKLGEVVNGKLLSLDYDEVNNRMAWATWQEVELEPNTEYTLSYGAKAKYGKGVAYTPIMRMVDKGKAYDPLQYISTVATYNNVEGDFKRYSFTFNTGKSSIIRIYFTSKSVNELVYIIEPKLEKGIKTTPYQPNPEDIYGANDPNKSVDLQAKDVDGNILLSKSLPLYESKPGTNLLADKDIIKNTNKFSYVQGDTKELIMSLWGTRITQNGSMGSKLKAGKTYTISYDMEMLEEPTVPVYRQSPGIIVYTREPSKVIAETRFINSKDNKRRIPIGDKERVELTFTMTNDANVELTAYTGLFNETGEPLPYETREYSKVKFSNIKLEEGTKATIYEPSPENYVSFLDKTIQFNGAYTTLQSIGIKNQMEIQNVGLEYSYYGNNWKKLKYFNNIGNGETHTDNNTVDLYGLTTVNYSDINPMSKVSLKSIWDITFEQLNDTEGAVSDMDNSYFNAIWTTHTYLSELALGSFKVLNDVFDGVMDNSLGKVLTFNLMDKIYPYTTIDNLGTAQPKNNLKLLAGSSEFIEDVKDKPLNTTNIEAYRGIRVIPDTK